MMQIKETFQKNVKLDCVIFGALLGMLVFFLIYGIEPLNVSNDKWILTGYVENDIIQHYAGWVNFRNADWSWPLGYMDTVAYPAGTYITFTDSIPIMALFFKLISGILPETFQYFGIYVLVCFILQGISASLLLTEFTENRMAVKVATVLFVVSPIMIERAFHHTGLASHFFVLFALYFYFHSRHNGYKYEWGFAVLLVLAVLIHPYFLPMVFGIMCANLLELIINRKNFVQTTGFAVFSIIPCLVVAYAIGAIGSGVPAADGQYGLFSMNLNALVNPVSCGGIIWSGIMNELPQIRGNYDAFNYLGGAGILVGLIVIPIGMIMRRIKMDLFFLKRNIGIMIASVVFFCFAVSNVVTYNEYELFFVQLPQKIYDLCSIFRASGRIFYPDYYLIILAVVLAVLKVFPRKETAVLILLLCVQIFDLVPGLKVKHDSFKEEVIDQNYEEKIGASEVNWSILAENHSEVKFVQNDSNVLMAVFTGKAGIKGVNIFISNRGEKDNIISEIALEEIMSGRLKNEVLYVISDMNTASIIGQSISDEYAVYYVAGAFIVSERVDELADIEFVPDGKVVLSDISDNSWENGVAIYAPTEMLFEYNSFVEQLLYDNKYIQTENNTYTIQSVTVMDGYIKVIVDHVENAVDLSYPSRLQLTNDK